MAVLNDFSHLGEYADSKSSQSRYSIFPVLVEQLLDSLILKVVNC